MEPIDIEINPGRLLYGLSRIGYTTSSALCDIIDNSVRANASEINLVVEKEKKSFSDSRKNNVLEYLVIDNGDGMDLDAIKNCLVLGSDSRDYEENTLSKFGLGLKSASFSQGDVLEIISSKEHGKFNKFKLSLPKIMEEGSYFATNETINETDQHFINKYLSGGKGTIIRLGEIRKNNHPSVKNTISVLKKRLGVIYYYFIVEINLKIRINDDIVIEAFDPLFAAEADKNGNLNENEWLGREVKWIEKKQELTLDDELGITIQIEATQLPYPPIFKFDKIAGDSEVREKYNIGAGNYGFYVYRNKRLISWASLLQGIIPYDQDFYSFRGRIFIEDEADDFFNIDVKKSTITLSDEALNVISDFIKEAKNKSRRAWEHANEVRKNIINKEPNEIANKIIDDFDQIELLPGDEILEDDVIQGRVEMIESDMAEKVKLIAQMAFEDKGQNIDVNDLSPEELKTALKGGEENPNLKKIFRVTSVIDNHLWEPYYDTELGVCVRINKIHRFARLIYEDNVDNNDLQIVFDLLLLQLAESEMYAYKNISNYSYEQLKTILTEFRRICSEFLANMCRRLENELPPNFSRND
ncbi:MAG: ATP-binding protein [Bacteroidota bacterium]